MQVLIRWARDRKFSRTRSGLFCGECDGGGELVNEMEEFPGDPHARTYMRTCSGPDPDTLLIPSKLTRLQNTDQYLLADDGQALCPFRCGCGSRMGRLHRRRLFGG